MIFLPKSNTLKNFYFVISVLLSGNINGGDVQRKNVVNNVDKTSLWAP